MVRDPVKRAVSFWLFLHFERQGFASVLSYHRSTHIYIYMYIYISIHIYIYYIHIHIFDIIARCFQSYGLLSSINTVSKWRTSLWWTFFFVREYIRYLSFLFPTSSKHQEIHQHPKREQIHWFARDAIFHHLHGHLHSTGRGSPQPFKCCSCQAGIHKPWVYSCLLWRYHSFHVISFR